MKLALRHDGLHPSEHALARHCAGEGDEAGQERIQAHLDGCSACARTMQELDDLCREFGERHDRVGFLAAVRERAEEAEDEPAFWRVLFRPAGLAFAAAAAALLVVLLVARPWGPGEESKERIKSVELELGYVVMDRGRPIKAGPERVLHPGDRVQFKLSAPRGGFVHIVGVDMAGRVSVYFPRPGEAPEAYPGGSGRPVPGSVILDATLGRERVFALICATPLDRDKLAGRVRGLADDPRVWIERDRLPVDCRQTSLVLVKE